jgi:DNA-binding NtrC family response regulator
MTPVVLIAALDPAWRSPLEAMLQVRGYAARALDDAFDAVAAVSDADVVALVFRAGDDPDAAMLAARTARKRARGGLWIAGVGGGDLDAAARAYDHWVPDPFGYAAVVAALEAARAASAEAEVAAHLSDGAVEALLRTARMERYHVLLDVAEDADDATIRQRANTLLAQVATARDSSSREELLETIRDARDVLTSPRAAALYARGRTS